MNKAQQNRLARLLLCTLLFFSLAPLLQATAAGLQAAQSAEGASVAEATYTSVLDGTYLDFAEYERTEGDRNTVFHYSLKLPVAPSYFAGSILQLTFGESLTFVGSSGTSISNQLSLPIDPAAWGTSLSPELTASVTGNTIDFSFTLAGKYKSDRTLSILLEADGGQKLFTVPAPSRDMSEDPKAYGSDHIDMGNTSITEDKVTGKAKLHLVVVWGDAKISFSSYRYPLGTKVEENGQPYEVQILHDSISVTYAPGTYDLEIDLPDVGPYQTDLYVGGVLVHPGKDGHGKLFLKSHLQIWNTCRANAQPLELAVVPGAEKHVWTVTSKLDVPAYFNWEIEGTTQKGTGVVIPANSKLTIATVKVGAHDKLTVELLPCGTKTSLVIPDTPTSTPTPTPTPSSSSSASASPTPTTETTPSSSTQATPSSSTQATPSSSTSAAPTSASSSTPTPGSAAESANISPSVDTVSPDVSPSPSGGVLIDVSPGPLPLGGGTASTGSGATGGKKTLPQTGESLPLGYYAAGLLLIGAGLGTLRLGRKRSR